MNRSQSKAAKYGTLVFILVVVGGISALAYWSWVSHKDSQTFSQFEGGGFSFEYPDNWTKLSGELLYDFRKQVLGETRDFAKAFPGTRPEDVRLSYFGGVIGRRKETGIFLLVIQIPPQTELYLDVMYEEGTERLQWGIDQGTISSILKNEIITINSMPAIETVILSAGVTTRSISFYFPEIPDKIYLFNCISESYGAHTTTFDHAVATLNIERE